jgi:hypothetical protein
MANHVTRAEWDEFWSRLWSAVWNIIGLLTAVIAFIGTSAWLVYVAYDAFQTPNKYKSTSPINQGKVVQLSQSERQSLQSAFNVLLASETRPCATKNKGEKFSNVRGCSLFRIKLGMWDRTISKAIDASGYFSEKAFLYDGCQGKKESCVYGRWISDARDGFSIRINFNYTNDSPTMLEATHIDLSFDAGAHPYFEPDSIRSNFVKAIGPPDHSDQDRDTWGKWDGPYIEARVTKDKVYSIRLQDRSLIKRNGDEKEAKKDGDKK